MQIQTKIKKIQIIYVLAKKVWVPHYKLLGQNPP